MLLNLKYPWITLDFTLPSKFNLKLITNRVWKSKSMEFLVNSIEEKRCLLYVRQILNVYSLKIKISGTSSDKMTLIK